MKSIKMRLPCGSGPWQRQQRHRVLPSRPEPVTFETAQGRLFESGGDVLTGPSRGALRER